MDTAEASLNTGEPPHPHHWQRIARWRDVAPSLWNDWRWQAKNLIRTIDDLEGIVPLREAEKKKLAPIAAEYHFAITPHYASLIDPSDPHDPIRRQVIPLGREQQAFTAMMEDSLAEDRHSPVPGLVHRYPDRVLLLITTQCASYCRYCTRSRIVGDPSAQFSRSDYDAQIDYIARTPQVRDVLLSGGDPLVLPIRILDDLLRRLRAIPHVEIIRIGSRITSHLPERITPEFCEMVKRFHPVYMNTHFDHPNELTPAAVAALGRLADAGVPLGCQTVLLRGVNDDQAAELLDVYHQRSFTQVPAAEIRGVRPDSGAVEGHLERLRSVFDRAAIGRVVGVTGDKDA